MLSSRLLQHPAAIFSVLAVMTICMLHACWDSPFVKFDDRVHIVGSLRRTPLETFRTPSPSEIEDGYETYFPLTALSYHLDYWIFGPSAPQTFEDVFDSHSRRSSNWAPGLRVMNGLYHTLAGLLLWAFLYRFGAGAGISALVAILWTGHPMACESVCWISERKNVLTALFGFGALLAWTLETGNFWRWPLVLILYACALLSKPSALGLLPVFFCFEWLAPRPNAVESRPGWRWIPLIALVAISCGAIIIGLSGHHKERVDPPGGTLATALMTDTEIFARYVFNVIAPADLSFFYGVVPITSLSDSRVWLYGLALVAFFGALIRFTDSDRRHLVILGILWFLGALGPSANIIAFPYWMQDRYAYLSSAGLLLAIVVSITSILRHWRVSEKALPALSIIVIFVTCGLSANRSHLFQDSDTLILDAAARQMNSGKAQMAALDIYLGRFFHFSQIEHNPKLAALNGEAVLRQAKAAMNCPDLYNFSSLLNVKIYEAEVLRGMGRYREARESLKPWLPPPNQVMLPADNPVTRRDLINGYTAASLAAAWVYYGRATAEEEGTTVQLSFDERLALCNEVLHSADEAARANNADCEAAMLKALAFLRMAELHTAVKDSTAARKDYDTGIGILKQVPPNSKCGTRARRLIASTPPPSIENSK